MELFRYFKECFKHFLKMYLNNYTKTWEQENVEKFFKLLSTSSLIEYFLVLSLFFIGFEFSYRFITTLAYAYMLGVVIFFSFYQIHLYIYNSDENQVNEKKNKIEKLIIKCFKVLYIGYNLIWMFVFSTIFTIFQKLKIQIILKYFSCIMPCYFIFIYTLILFILIL